MPLLERLERADWRFALGWWHWWFFGQMDKPAERVINADPDAWYAATAEHMGQEAYGELRRALHDPEVVHGMLEDYRAGLREDRDHDAEDRAAGRRITSPLLVISLLQDDPDLDYGTDILEIWRAWATDVRGADRLWPPRRGGEAPRARPPDTRLPRGGFEQHLGLETGRTRPPMAPRCALGKRRHLGFMTGRGSIPRQPTFGEGMDV